MPVISVIVPVYKVEEFLCRCVDSILCQSYRDFELILVDDGSHDNSLKICMEYYEKYPDKAKAFAEASRRGWEWAHEHPEQTVDIVMEIMKREQVPASRMHQEWMLREVLKLQFPEGGDRPDFRLDAEKVRELNALMMRHGRIEKELGVEQIQGR